MKRSFRPLLFALLGALALAGKAAATESTMDFGRFGTVHIYQPTPHPSRVALFVSGDGGWNLGVVDMARMLAQKDTLVIGISIRTYFKSIEGIKDECYYPVQDFAQLSQYVQQKLGLPTYQLPVLIGYSSGATLVYAILAEAPANTFRGAVALGFCPDLVMPKPMCKAGNLEWDMKKGTTIFRPAAKLEGKFVALQGMIDQVCDPPSTERYMQQVGNGQVVMLPKVGHGFSVPSRWQKEFERSVSELFALHAVGTASAPAPVTPAGVEDLPLVEVPAAGKPLGQVVVLLSGDGGWAGIDKDLGSALAGAGMPVVGWNSLEYFWNARSPAQASTDLARILRHYFAAWKVDRAILIGYSFGADAMPFLVTRLPPDLRSKVSLVALLGPSHQATFEFHVREWLHANGHAGDATLPEVLKLRGTPMLCVYGEKEAESLCHDLPAGLAKLLPTAGSHHFGGDYQRLAAAVLAAVRGESPQGTR